MKIWKLSPLDLDFSGWCCSAYRSDAIVRAESEEEARDIASHRFHCFTEKVSPCQETPRSPWVNHSVVKCVELDNSDYSTDGPAGLLEPKDF
jgi:hypothetical protein